MLISRHFHYLGDVSFVQMLVWKKSNLVFDVLTPSLNNMLILAIITVVFPEPAPALTKIKRSRQVIACNCCLLNIVSPQIILQVRSIFTNWRVLFSLKQDDSRRFSLYRVVREMRLLQHLLAYLLQRHLQKQYV